VREEIAVHLSEDRKERGASGERRRDRSVREPANAVLEGSDASNGHDVAFIISQDP
jgi:hypothetical protein